MPNESKNVDRRCTFLPLVSSYDQLYAMNDNKDQREALTVHLNQTDHMGSIQFTTNQR